MDDHPTTPEVAWSFKVHSGRIKEISLPISVEVDFRVAPQPENHPDGTAFTTREERADALELGSTCPSMVFPLCLHPTWPAGRGKPPPDLGLATVCVSGRSSRAVRVRTACHWILEDGAWDGPSPEGVTSDLYLEMVTGDSDQTPGLSCGSQGDREQAVDLTPMLPQG